MIHALIDRGNSAMLASALRRLAAAAAAAVLAPLAVHAQPAGENVVLAVPNVALTFAPGYLAEDLGLFAKHGLNVKSVVITGIGSANAVISGSADFAQISGATLTRAAARGQRLIGIASTLNRPTIQIVLRKEIAAAAGFDPKAALDKRAQLMRSRTIAVDSINSVIHAYVLLLARRAGYNPDDIRIAPMAPNSAMAAFQTRQVDGFAMSMPWPLQPVLEGNAVVIASGSDGDPPDMYPFGHNIFVAKPETCERRKSACAKLGKALVEAIDTMLDRPAQALPLLKKRFEAFDDKLLAAGFAEIRKGAPRPPAVGKADLENAELYNIGAGLLKPEEKLKSYDGLYTDEYVK
jgi:ABC-type nitrate/sulfonate/bicarbonate transport system substrate-binding protein